MNRLLMFFSALIVLAISPPVTYAQTSETEEEAPESIFQFDVGDTEVDLFLTGEWEARSEFGYTWQFPLSADSSRAARQSIPGLAYPLPLLNRVDLTVSLWLLERYFFEAVFSDQIESSTFALGYTGATGELVQSVRLGTTGIGIGAYPFLGFGGNPGTTDQDGPGASIRLTTPTSEHEAMLRFSPGSSERLIWSRGTLVTANEIEISEFVRRSYFVLPDGGVGELRLFEQSPSGPLTGSDGQRYRELSLDEAAAFSLIDGTLRFRQPLERKTLVYYEVSGTPIGHPSLGRASFYGLGLDRAPDDSFPRDFSFDPADIDELLAFMSADPAADGPDPDPELSLADVRVSIAGVDTMVLFQPGRLSAFERLVFYEGDARSAEFRISSAGDVPVESSLQITPDPLRPVFSVRSDPGSARAFGNRYPFAGPAIGVPQPEVYPPAGGRPDPHVIVVEERRRSSEIVLSADTEPASIRVTRNGLPETQFTLGSSGAIVFSRPLTDTDVVEVSYRVSAGDGTDALLGLGNTFRPADGVRLETALGARWNANAGAYSTQPGENLGYVVLSGRAELDETSRTGEWLSADASAALSFTASDTTGVLRLESMDGEAITLRQSAHDQFPAAPPVVDPDSGDGLPVTNSERGLLRYRDLFVTDAFGNRELSSYEFRNDVSPSPVAEGERTGPYPARVGEDEYTGTAMVLEYELPAGAVWAGAQLELPQVLDLSTAGQLELPYFLTDEVGTVEFYLQLGYLPEDLDADNVLDSGSGELPFDDTRTGLSLLAGVPRPPDDSYTEDRNGNAVLDPGAPERTVTIGPLALVPGSWQTLAIPVSEEQRARLAETRAVSLLVLRDLADGLPRSGTVMAGDISVAGEPLFLTTPGAPQSASARAYSRSNSRTAAPLRGNFPDVDSTILNEETSGTHLTADWNGVTAGSVRLERQLNVPTADYEELRVYANHTAGPTSPVVAVRAATGAGIIAERTLTLESNQWHAIVVEIPSDPAEVVTRIEIEITGASSGTVLLDEISFWKPRSAVGVAGELGLRLTPAVQLSMRGADVLSQVQLDQTFTGRTGRVPGAAGDSAELTSSTELSALLLSGAAATSAEVLWQNEHLGTAFGHSLERPITGLVTFGDVFRSSTGALGNRWSHRGTIMLSPTPTLIVDAQWSQSNDTQLDRTWSLRLNDTETLALPVETAAEAIVTERGEALSADSYGARWITGYTGIAGINEATEREISLAAEAGVRTEPFGFEPAIGITGTSDQATEQSTFGVTGSIGAPWALASGRSITLSLLRDVELTVASVPASSAASAYQTAFTSFERHPAGLFFPPFYELFDPEFENRFAAESAGTVAASYSPEIGLAFRSPPTSSAVSLLLPVSAAVAIRRTAEREANAVQSFYSGEFQSSFVSVNLFGRMGAVPLFSFYDSDEFQTRVLSSVTEVPGEGYRTDLSLDQQTTLFFPGGSRLETTSTVEAVLAREPETSVWSTVQYDWISHMRNLDRQTNTLVPPDMQLEHSEMVEFRIEQALTELASVRVRHESRLLITDQSSVTGFLGVAVARTTEPHDLFLVGVEVGISGIVRY